MGKANFSDEFKRDAVAQITKRRWFIRILQRSIGSRPIADLTSPSHYGSARLITG